MAKTRTTLFEPTTLAPLHILTLENRSAEECVVAPDQLSQADYIDKVRSSYPVHLPSSRPTSPPAQSFRTLLPPVDKKDRLNDENIFEDGHANRTSLAALDCTHWLEVMDARHRYGSYLRPYYDAWVAVGARDSFFSWLDEGEGLNVDFQQEGRLTRKFVSRAQLERSRVRYCSEQEREQYRAVIRDGVLVWASENAPGGRGKYSRVDTNLEPKWIFVIDVSGNLYVNRKRKGSFHHSSFVAGAPVRAAGRIAVDDGTVVCIGPNSGHYRTTWEQLLNAVDGFFGKCLNVVPPSSCGTHEAECIRVVPRQTQV